MTAQVTTQAIGEVNGVDVDGLVAIIERCTREPGAARTQWRAQNTWLGGSHNRTSMQGFFAAGREDESRRAAFVIEADEPPVLLGANRGANPVEHVLTGLLGCLTTTLVYYAAAEGIVLDSVRSRAEADLDLRGLFGIDAAVRPGFQEVRVTFDLRSKEPRERLEALLALVRTRSAVMDIVSAPVPVTLSLGA